MLCFVTFATAMLHNVYRPETACDSDGDEGDGEGDDRQQNSRYDDLLARDNLMCAIFP